MNQTLSGKPGAVHIWWVNTGARFNAQRQAGALWCPNKTVRKDRTEGPPQWHWSIIEDVRPGEFVLVAREGFIEGVAIAKQSAIPNRSKPDTFPPSDSWHPLGWLLPINFVQFKQRIPRNEVAEGLFRYRAHRSPFFINQRGELEGNQVYFAELPGADAAVFFERIRQELEIQRPGELDSALDRTNDNDEAATKEQETTRRAIIEARVGQGQFRQALLDMWGGRCCVTGLSQTSLLRASHIVPWSAASARERLDPFNGLLLSAAYDAAFDAHLITVMPDGRWENVARLDTEELERAGLSQLERQNVGNLQEAHHQYLARHRANAREKWGSA